MALPDAEFVDDGGREAFARRVQQDVGRGPDELRTVLDDGVVIEPMFLPDDVPAGAAASAATPWRATWRDACPLADAAAMVSARLDEGWEAVLLRCPELDAVGAALDLAPLRDLPADRVLLGLGPENAAATAAALAGRGVALPLLIDDLASCGGLPPALALARTFAALAAVLDRAAGAAANLCVGVAVGTEVVQQAAAMRAARALWQQTAAAATGAGDPPAARIYAAADVHAWSASDPHNNLVRGALQAFAATAGGATWLQPLAFDPAGAADESRRLALGQLRVLRCEAGLDGSVDVIGGSWAFDTLAVRIAERARALLHGPDPVRAVDAARAAERERIRHRRQVVVGSNRFVDPAAPTAPTPATDAMRRAAEFEHLRRRTAARPVRAVLLAADADAEGRARAGFARDLLLAAGIAVVEGGVDPGADLHVWCGEVPADGGELRRLAQQPEPRPLLYTVGAPPPGSAGWGHVGFLHGGLDAVGTLAGILDRCGAPD